MSDYNTLFGKEGVDNERINFECVFEQALNTDVSGVTSDGTYKRGLDEFPIFNVNYQEFNANMESHRQRLRFSGKAGQYLRETRYKRPFYIRHTDESGKVYIRKIK